MLFLLVWLLLDLIFFVVFYLVLVVTDGDGIVIILLLFFFTCILLEFFYLSKVGVLLHDSLHILGVLGFVLCLLFLAYEFLGLLDHWLILRFLNQALVHANLKLF